MVVVDPDQRVPVRLYATACRTTPTQATASKRNRVSLATELAAASSLTLVHAHGHANSLVEEVLQHSGGDTEGAKCGNEREEISDHVCGNVPHVVRIASPEFPPLTESHAVHRDRGNIFFAAGEAAQGPIPWAVSYVALRAERVKPSRVMIDVIKKTLLAGVGAVVITKDKVEAALGEFVQQGKVSSAEARAMADKIADQGRREFETLSHELNEKLREAFTSSQRKTQDRVEALEARVAALERMAAAQTAKPEGPSVTASGTTAA
jgi:polyhydroxyalkanoate synthesis regulator phasin